MRCAADLRPSDRGSSHWNPQTRSHSPREPNSSLLIQIKHYRATHDNIRNIMTFGGAAVFGHLWVCRTLVSQRGRTEMDATPFPPRIVLIAAMVSLMPYGTGGFAGAASPNTASAAMTAKRQAQAAAKFGGSRPSSVYIARNEETKDGYILHGWTAARRIQPMTIQGKKVEALSTANSRYFSCRFDKSGRFHGL